MQNGDTTYRLNKILIHYFFLFYNMSFHLADLGFTITMQIKHIQLLLEHNAMVMSMEIKERTKHADESIHK